MSKALGRKKEHSSVVTRTEQVQGQLHQLSARNLHLWSIGALAIVVVTAATLAFVTPNLVWAPTNIKMQQLYLPQVLFGLISLILLFNICLLIQKSSLNATRHSLISELVVNERLESLSLVDPVTQLLNRRGMTQLIPKEVARSNRMGGSLTFMKIDIHGFNELNTKFGDTEGNFLLSDFGKLLKAIFRGGDTVFRLDGPEFLIAMPDTSELQCEPPLQRLLRSVEQWNLNNSKPYELSFRWAFTAYAIGSDFEDTLRTLDRKMFLTKNTVVPAF
ncbi:MAG TPA: GGDEF domain-containing protein [Terriglobales bacterium]|jgi:diguanylate cyclase (GGDEF)-like protein|nr:GGDEF domain-containing protein [Terriglobales bacterium]